jgi:hypothetical protein
MVEPDLALDGVVGLAIPTTGCLVELDCVAAAQLLKLACIDTADGLGVLYL